MQLYVAVREVVNKHLKEEVGREKAESEAAEQQLDGTRLYEQH